MWVPLPNRNTSTTERRQAASTRSHSSRKGAAEEAWQNRRNGDVDGQHQRPTLSLSFSQPEQRPQKKTSGKTDSKPQGSQENDLFEDDDDDYF